MKLETLVLADAVATSGGKAHLLGVGTTRINPPHLPWKEPTLAIFARFTLSPSDANQEHLIALGILGPDGGQIVVPAQFTLHPSQVRALFETSAPGETVAAQVTSAIMGALFEVGGVYQVIASLDGVRVATYPLVVVSPETGRPEA